MANVYLTSANVLAFQLSDLDVGVLSELLNRSPVLAAAPARAVPGVQYSYMKVTAEPNVGFRAANAGLENVAPTYAKVDMTLTILDASYAVDKALADAFPGGRDAALGEVGAQHLQAAFFEAEKQILYGTGNDNAGFVGLASLVDGLTDATVVNAGGSTASTGSSVFAVRWGTDGAEVLWGNNGQIAIDAPSVVDRAATTGTFPAYYVPVCTYGGLKLGTAYSVGRICNLTEDTGKGLTDDLISELLSKFPAASPPNMLVMNRRSLRQLQQSRTATNATGAPAPFPQDAFGIPIVVTDAILSTEAIIAA